MSCDCGIAEVESAGSARCCSLRGWSAGECTRRRPGRRQLVMSMSAETSPFAPGQRDVGGCPPLAGSTPRDPRAATALLLNPGERTGYRAIGKTRHPS